MPNLDKSLADFRQKISAESIRKDVENERKKTAKIGEILSEVEVDQIRPKLCQIRL